MCVKGSKSKQKARRYKDEVNMFAVHEKLGVLASLVFKAIWVKSHRSVLS